MKLRQAYNRIDEKLRDLSRTKYAILIGFTSATGALIAGTALGEPNYIFSITIGLTMTVFYYISNPNEKKPVS